MRTDLNIVEPEIVAGAKIDVVKHRVRNFRLHNSLECLSRLLITIVEVQSNDSNSTAVPSDVREVWAQFNLIKGDLDFAELVNDAPLGQYQHAFHVYLVHQKEIQRVRNVKVKRVAQELWLLAMVMLGADSSDLQNFTSETDFVKFRRAVEVAELSMTRWIGSGASDSETGVYAPAFRESGEILPDVDGDFATRLEPSKTKPAPQLDDAPDV